MRVLLINTAERIGGAAIAASRLLQALRNNGIKAKLLVRDKQTDDINVVRTERNWLGVWNFIWERVVILFANRFRRKNIFAVDIANTGNDITSLPEFKEADIIHLHWINQGMLSLKNIRKILQSGKPVIWTLHDMWPLTGICHYSHKCDRYQHECNHCPFLHGGGGRKDLSNRIFHRKRKLYAQNKSVLRFVTVSNWQCSLMSKSTLLGSHPISVIPNNLPSGAFSRLSKQACRTELSLPAEKYILIFGAARMDNSIKGFQHLLEAIRLLDSEGIISLADIHLLLFGSVKNEEAFFDDLPVKYTWFGTVNDTHLLSKLYSASDVYVMPSLYETFGQTLIEAMACGCVPVAFDNSGPGGIIDHLHNGYTAHFLSIEDLANGIRWILKEADYPLLSEQAIRKAARYSESSVARQYIDLYNQVTGKHE